MTDSTQAEKGVKRQRGEDMATRRMREDTFNLMVAAGILIVVAVVAFVIVLMSTRTSCRETTRQVETAEGAPDVTVTYHFDDVRAGVFVLPTEDTPWRREEVLQAAANTLSPDALYGKEVPYLTAKPSLRARPEALLALAEASRGMPATPGVRLRLEYGYLSWEAAGERAGTSLHHTGYALCLSLMVEGVGVMTIEEALSHPVAASPAAWLNVNLPLYGFLDGEEPGQVLYVGVPHAREITAGGLSLASYLHTLRQATQESPMHVEGEGGRYDLFWHAAAWGGLALEVSERASVTVSGDGEGGYYVTLFYPRA